MDTFPYGLFDHLSPEDIASLSKEEGLYAYCFDLHYEYFIHCEDSVLVLQFSCYSDVSKGPLFRRVTGRASYQHTLRCDYETVMLNMFRLRQMRYPRFWGPYHEVYFFKTARFERSTLLSRFRTAWRRMNVKFLC